MRRLYKKYLNTYAAVHRNNSTKAEVRLWCEVLRKRQLRGFRFRRQVPLGKFIADFYCQELNLVIEVDGYTHDTYLETIENDREKDAFFERMNLKVLRFSDDHVFNNIDDIREVLENYASSFPEKK